ncbi:hypothetical protein CEXT_338151 [Caerostris extrusa]|uniref:Uncharacterized protein n=1 Tax=Caerostris extrusa TaxID=172846 RepID=A0AAV4VCP7_CAEEX|nr:hypothetical protein CEXT_338151 [Caerostris extrusa]
MFSSLKIFKWYIEHLLVDTGKSLPLFYRQMEKKNVRPYHFAPSSTVTFQSRRKLLASHRPSPTMAAVLLSTRPVSRHSLFSFPLQHRPSRLGRQRSPRGSPPFTTINYFSLF